MAEKILVTSALPYANGPIHIGHICVGDPSGVSALVAGPTDIVISSHPYLSMATVLVIEDNAADIDLLREVLSERTGWVRCAVEAVYHRRD